VAVFDLAATLNLAGCRKRQARSKLPALRPLGPNPLETRDEQANELAWISQNFSDRRARPTQSDAQSLAKYRC